MAITIRIRDNGPYAIAAEDAQSIQIVDAAGRRYLPVPGKTVALCRCGHSSRKPFCDGTHRTIGFDGTLTAPAAPPASDPPAATYVTPAPGKLAPADPPIEPTLP